MPKIVECDRIQSDALTKNMDITNVEVVVPEFDEILLEAVKGYAGKEQQTRELLMEYHHKYRNWPFVIQEAWRYAVSNLRLYREHPYNGRVVFLLARIFFEALRDSQRDDVRSLAADHVISFWMKLCDEMPQELSKPVPEGVSVKELDRNIDGITSCHEGIARYYLYALSCLPEDALAYLLRSFYQSKRLAAKLLKLWPDSSSYPELRTFLSLLAGETYRFWLLREDPCDWLAQHFKETGSWGETCAPLGHGRYRALLEKLEKEIDPEPDDRKAVEQLAELTDFHDIVHYYHKLPDRLKPFDGEDQAGLSLLMRLKIMEIRGLEAIHEETLREINHHVARWIHQEKPENLHGPLEKIFNALDGCFRNYPEAALQIIKTIGLEVVETEDKLLTSFFLRRIIRMGFQTPQLGGVSQHWQIAVNTAHLPNIRVFLEIIKKNPTRAKMLLSALIVDLSLGGIYIRDTDLFQKDVSQLLHAPIAPVYNLVKQLAKIFPVYFNQIGAEGQLRAVSTDVDELTGRSDRLIHFLRKQSHVESNNVVVSFIEAIIEFWRTLDKTGLKELVPEEIYPQIVTSGPLVEEVHRIFKEVFKTVLHVKDFLELPEEEVLTLISAVEGVSERERRRAFLLIQFYQLLHEKYALSFKDIDVHLQRAANMGLPDPTSLLDALHQSEPCVKLSAILDYLLELKEVILSPGEMQVLESIYYKRHIAVDIPSMYGSYNERKFDALGLTFRLENLANVLFEEIILSFNLSFITRATFSRIAKFLPLFIKALAIDGITSNRLERQEELFLKALEVRRFSHSQYIDIFRGFSEAIKQIIQTNYHSVHEENLETIIKRLGPENLLPRYSRDRRAESASDWNQRISESFLRELIARTFGLQYFDHFISSILTTLATQKEELSSEMLDLLLSYDPEKTTSFVYAPVSATYDLIHLGNKGYTLAKLHTLGIKVPPAFTITSEYFRCRSVIESFSQSREDFQERVMSSIAL
ncbi:MAG: phosphoenolpyruvate synthase, partial [Acidobacteriota bacterium]